MIEMRWQKSFGVEPNGIINVPAIGDDPSYWLVLQFREWPPGLHPDVELGKNPHIEPNWQDVPID